MAPVIRQLKTYDPEIKISICITAQHRQMLDQVLKMFKIQPDYDLNIMNENQDLFDITGQDHIKRVRQCEPYRTA